MRSFCTINESEIKIEKELNDNYTPVAFAAVDANVEKLMGQNDAFGHLIDLDADSFRCHIVLTWLRSFNQEPRFLYSRTGVVVVSQFRAGQLLAM